MAKTTLSVAGILVELARMSKRPRYAVIVLNLLCELADDRGKVGPWIREGRERVALREWVGERLAAMADTDTRRAELAARTRAKLVDQLPEDLLQAQAMVDEKVGAHARKVAADNFSRVVTELEAAGYLKRFYEGRITDHRNRGGRRLLTCVIDGDVLAAMRRRDTLL